MLLVIPPVQACTDARPDVLLHCWRRDTIRLGAVVAHAAGVAAAHHHWNHTSVAVGLGCSTPPGHVVLHGYGSITTQLWQPSVAVHAGTYQILCSC